MDESEKDEDMTTTVPPTTAVCPNCHQLSLVPKKRELTEKKRVKFGFIWLMLCLATMGMAFFAWLVWPRRSITIGVDRWQECQSCGFRV